MVVGRELARPLRCTKRRLAPLGSRGTGSIVHALPPEKGSAFGTARVQNYAPQASTSFGTSTRDYHLPDLSHSRYLPTTALRIARTLHVDRRVVLHRRA